MMLQNRFPTHSRQNASTLQVATS